MRAGWAIAAVYLLVAALIAVDLAVAGSDPGDAIVPLLTLAATAATLFLLALRPSRAAGSLFLGIGTVANFVYQVSLLTAEPELATDGAYLLNRLSCALVLVGPIGRRLISGISWCSAGFALGAFSTVAAALSAGAPIAFGNGPLLTWILYMIIIVVLDRIRESQPGRVPNLEELEAETARLAGQRQLEEKVAALVHDTVLNDLVAISASHGRLDPRAADRIRSDLDALAEASIAGEPTDEHLTEGLRDELLAVIRELQWRGLTVDVTGGDAVHVPLSSDALTATVGALTACLDNVLKHAGVAEAQVYLEANDGQLTVMVTDDGAGFEPSTIPTDRLGIRGSIIGRIEAVGGHVRLWSSPGSGTSVMIAVPLAGERVTDA